MSAIMIRDLACTKELDRKGMSAVRGGALVDLTNVGNPHIDINVSQNINALQFIDVAVLNNSFIGADLDFGLKLDPKLLASNKANIKLK